MITGEHIERAERTLRLTYTIGTGDPRIIADRARVDRTALENFMSHHRQRLFREYLPDIDPRLEPAIMTMMLHMFAVGAIAQRRSSGAES